MVNFSQVENNNLDEQSILLSGGTGGWIEAGFTWVVRIFTFGTVALLFWLSWVIFQEAKPAIAQFGLKFLWDQIWNVNDLTFGAKPYIYGTLVSSVIALILALPIGLAVALVGSEDFLPIWVRSPLAFVVEIIAAIPSVIVGLWGIFVLIPVLKPIELWLFNHWGRIPLFKTEDPSGPGMLAAGIILAIMILPTIAAITRDVLLAIPKELRSGSMALGATRWETIFRIVVPAGASGTLGAAMLALGRALGETMAVTMVIGNSTQISASLLEPASTIPAVLANEFAEALDKLHIGALMYLALILFVLTLIVNIAAVAMIELMGLKEIRN